MMMKSIVRQVMSNLMSVRGTFGLLTSCENFAESFLFLKFVIKLKLYLREFSNFHVPARDWASLSVFDIFFQSNVHFLGWNLMNLQIPHDNFKINSHFFVIFVLIHLSFLPFQWFRFCCIWCDFEICQITQHKSYRTSQTHLIDNNRYEITKKCIKNQSIAICLDLLKGWQILKIHPSSHKNW